MSLLGDLGRVACSPRRSRRAIACAVRLRGWRLSRRWPFLGRDAGARAGLLLEDALSLQACRSRHVHAVIVGAFDGDANDPGMSVLRALGARMLLVEPQPAVASALAARVAGDSRISVIEAALDATAGERVLYTVDEAAVGAGLPAWVGQIASFDRQHVLKHAAQVPGLPQFIREVRVPAVTWGHVLKQTGCGRLDYVQMDVEGHEAALIEAFPWEICRPGVMLHEVHHMPASQRERVATLLKSRGYVLIHDREGWNDLAVCA